MEKLKIDKYSIFGKKRLYDILVFPNFEYAWAFDDYPEEDRYMIDGDTEIFEILKYALVALIKDSSKIIYLPIKNPGVTFYGALETYNVVMVRPELQFRHSEWYKLKPRLDKKYWTGRYIIRYDDQKTEDYYEYLHQHHKYDKMTPALKREKNKLLGDTVFFTLPKEACYHYHHTITHALNKFDNATKYGIYAEIGYIIPHKSFEI